MIQTKKDFFYCYNPRLRKFLGLAGLRWNEKGFHENTKSYYWTFYRSEKLDKLINEYKISNPQ